MADIDLPHVKPPLTLKRRLRRLRAKATMQGMQAVAAFHEFRENRLTSETVSGGWRSLTKETTPHGALYIDASASDVMSAVKTVMTTSEEDRESHAEALESFWGSSKGDTIATLCVRVMQAGRLLVGGGGVRVLV